MQAPKGFSEFEFAYDGKARPIYYCGSGPAVILLHEMPGMIRQCINLGRYIAQQGFNVYMPLLLGRPNQPLPELSAAIHQVQICLSQEFYCFSRKKASPITDWLRALGREINQRSAGAGIGVIGMCLTGGFVLSMILDECVLAPVMAQPYLPAGVSKDFKSSLGIADKELAQIKAQTEAGLKILALRFEKDIICPAERFVRLREEFKDAIETIEIESKNPLKSHSTLTLHFVDEEGHPTWNVRNWVIEFLKERLQMTTIEHSA